MPNIITALPETQETVTRPMAIGLARKLMKELGLSGEINIDYAGAEEVTPQQDSTLTGARNKNFLGTSDNIVMTIEENYVQDRTLEASVMRRDNLPYFRDPNLFVYLRPIYVPTEVIINFTYEAADEVKVRRWRDDIRARAGLLRSEMVYKVDYNHPVPKEFLVILHEIWKLREKQAGYGGTYGDWLKECFDSRVTALASLAGQKQMVVIAETQVRILGSFNFVSVMGEPTYDKQKGTWSCGFDYTYVYDKPTMGAMTYPLMIHNQLIDERFRPDKPDYDLADEDIRPNHVAHVFNQLTQTFRPASQRRRIPRIPAIDTWWPEMEDKFITPFFVGLVAITPEDRRTLLDLNDLDIYELDATTKEWLRFDREFVVQEFRSLLSVALYTNDRVSIDGELELTEDLVLRATEDLDLRQVYHVRLGFLNNLSRLRPEDGERIRGYACVAGRVMEMTFPSLAAAGKIPSPTHRCRWSKNDWQQVVKDTTGEALKPDYIRNLYLSQTVGDGTLIAWRNANAVSND